MPVSLTIPEAPQLIRGSPPLLSHITNLVAASMHKSKQKTCFDNRPAFTIMLVRRVVYGWHHQGKKPC